MSTPVVPPTDAPATPRSRADTRQIWIDRLARFPDSGLTTAQFCAHEGVSLPSFYAWKRRLKAEHQGPSDTPGQDAPPRLLPVRLQAVVPVELVLPGGAVLRLLPGCDLDFVRSLLLSLGEAPC
jgi:transposase